jgi:hypothetical protein
VRSDLYACLPAVGTCIAAAAVCGALWRSATTDRRRVVLAGVLALIVPLSPVYYARTERWTSIAELGQAALDDLVAAAAGLPDEAGVVIEDDRTVRANLDSAFGTLLGDAYALRTGRRLDVWIEPPVTNAAASGMSPPCETCVRLRLKLDGGRLRKMG